MFLFVQNQNVYEKSKFWSKIEITKISIFGQKSKFWNDDFVTKLNIWSKSQLLAKNWNILAYLLPGDFGTLFSIRKYAFFTGLLTFFIITIFYLFQRHTQKIVQIKITVAFDWCLVKYLINSFFSLIYKKLIILLFSKKTIS